MVHLLSKAPVGRLRQPGPAPAGPERGHAGLFDDFNDAPASRLHDHRMIVHDRVAVARPHAILAGHRIKRYASGQQLADAYVAAIKKRIPPAK